MDWKRIKSILIYILIVVNIILIYRLYSEKINKKIIISNEDIINELNKRDIFINEEVMNTKDDISQIKISKISYDEGNFISFYKRIDEYFESKCDINIDGDIEVKKLFNLEDKVYDGDEKPFDRALLEIENFIEFIGFSNDYKLNKHYKSLDEYIFEFKQEHNGFLIDDSSMILSVNILNNEIRYFYRRWFNVDEE